MKTVSEVVLVGVKLGPARAYCELLLGGRAIAEDGDLFRLKVPIDEAQAWGKLVGSTLRLRLSPE